MTDSETIHQTALFNDAINGRLWFDVDVAECSPRAVVLYCGIDLSVGPNIEVRFDDIFFVSLLMTWKTDTTRPVLRVLTGEDAWRINAEYRVEKGYHLFAFQPEALAANSRCIIAAKMFSWQLVRAWK